MFRRLISIIGLIAIGLAVSPAWADDYQDTIDVFKKAGESGRFFNTAYGVRLRAQVIVHPGSKRRKA